MTAPCFVYFVQAGEGGRIKIGTSRNVQNRMVKMQTDTPIDLRLLAVFHGDAQREAEIHALLRSHHAIGEWFEPHIDVLEFIGAEKAKPGTIEYLPLHRKWDRPGCGKMQSWRLAQRLTLISLGKMCDASQAYLSTVETGRQMPGWKLMLDLYTLSDGEVTPNDFLPAQRATPKVTAECAR